MPYAESRAECERPRDQFVRRHGRLNAKTAETLCRDWGRMVTFYSFPKDHWTHLRTTNPVESPFSAVRLRTDAAKRLQEGRNQLASAPAGHVSVKLGGRPDQSWKLRLFAWAMLGRL